MTTTTTPTTDAAREALWQRALAAGNAAAAAAVPEPMYVVERANPLDDNSPIVKRYPPVMDGVCGFAWVLVQPATSAFARWMRRTKGTRKSYYGGEQYWVSEFGQSLTRKEAFARAFAAVLSEAGIKAYGQSRMD